MSANFPSTKVLSALGLVLALAACGGPTPVRFGSQAVHPSPSALAQSGVTAQPTLAAPCETPDTAPCYAAGITPVSANRYTTAAPAYGNDGATPIID